jgi:signal transduction histidine kinase
MPLLFEPFERGANDGPGLGLGLHIVRVIAEAHGGEVSVESSEEGGTTFRLRLPRAATAQDQTLAYA